MRLAESIDSDMKEALLSSMTSLHTEGWSSSAITHFGVE